MINFNNKSGFTLIEIVVVLVIVGVLAAIALPNLFSNIQKSRGAQALTTLDSYKTPLESCATLYSGTTVGSGSCTIAGQNLNVSLNKWTYTIPAAAVAQTGSLGTAVTPSGNTLAKNLVYSIQASDGTNTVVINRATNGSWSCSVGSLSPYTGIC